MNTNTIVVIAAVVVVALLLIAAITWVARKKRTEHHRAEAAEIREQAAEQSHKVGQREALADETEAKARAAQAEAEANAAHANGLRHQAQLRRSDATSARGEVDQDFERANEIDPDTDVDDSRRTASTTREPAREASTDNRVPPVLPKTR